MPAARAASPAWTRTRPSRRCSGCPPASSFDGLLSAAIEEVEHLPDYGDCVDDDVESATTATTAITVVRDRSRQLESKSSPLEEMRASETTFPPSPPPRLVARRPPSLLALSPPSVGRRGVRLELLDSDDENELIHKKQRKIYNRSFSRRTIQ